MRMRRWLFWGMGGMFAAVSLLLVTAGLLLRASLPQLEGTHAASSALSSSVIIERDVLGIPTLSGQRRDDLAYGTGFVHAQDRFFQMDMLRRTGAGELAELIGPKAIDTDKRNRVHRFRARAQAAMRVLPSHQRQILERYSEGVNDGLAALSGRPFEYWLLHAQPARWSPEDSLLAIYAMYLDLQGSLITNILSRGLLREQQPPSMSAFLLPRTSRWEAPLDLARSQSIALPTLPASAPGWLTSKRSAQQAAMDEFHVPASNSWAVANAHSVRGAAIVANDMHLGLRLPNIWYRLSLVYPNQRGRPRRVTGVSLPGAPAVVVGSNGHVAWGFTNHFGGGLDLIELQRHVGDAIRHRLPDANETIGRFTERIRVKGEEAVELSVLETRWGPILQGGKRQYAVRWVAHDPHAVDLTLMHMEDVDDVREALRVGQSSGIPSQNLIVGDDAGHIGWTIAGRVPRRAQPDDGFPISSMHYRPWSGYLKPHEYPSRVDPPLGRLWSGNNRQLTGSEQDKIGDVSMDMGARASQIRDGLLMHDRFDEQMFSAIQLDNRARWIEFWRHLVLESLDPAALVGRPERAELKRIIEQWNGRADVDPAGYTLVRSFYWSLYDAWFGQLDADMRKSELALSSGFGGISYMMASFRIPIVMEAVARQRSWIPASFSDWRSFMLDRVDDVISRSTKGGKSLNEARWGDVNRAFIAHPFASLLPGFGRWLSAPSDALPGDAHMPLINRRSYGASQRMVVAPGHEASGLFHMPGGQSGHPLSPFFLAGHEAWARGESTPFLPGPSRYRLTLETAKRDRLL